MASEAVEVIVSADDQASKKFAQVAANAEAQVKRIKEVGQKTKATTELAGTISNLAGGTQFGAFAGQIGALTEKVSQFSEVSKAGGAGALAFKAGLVAATAVVTYQIGSAIGSWIFQQKDLNAELEKTSALIRESSGDALKKFSQEFADKREDISLLPNKDTQKAELRALLAETESAFAKEEAIYNSKKDLEDAADKAAAEAHKARMRQLKDQEDQLKRALSGRDEQIAKQKELNAEMGKSKDFVGDLEKEVAMLRLKAEETERIRNVEALIKDRESKGEVLSAEERAAMIAKAKGLDSIRSEANQKTFGGEDTSKAVALLKEKEGIELLTKIRDQDEQKKEQDAEKEKQRAKQLEQLKKQEFDSLKERRIALEQGEEAARRYALQVKGIDAATAAQIAREEKKLSVLEAQKNATNEPLQARESRLLARGPVDSTKEMMKQQVERLTNIERGIDQIANARNVRFVEVM